VRRVNREIVEYIGSNIIPRYNDFDKAHKVDHARKVIDNSRSLANEFDVDINMVYVIAAYHDVGLDKGRKDHEKNSAIYLLNDTKLKEWFTDDELKIMADAVEDHRASNEHEPRSIYGKIVAEADRDIEYTTILTRTILYSLEYYPDYCYEEHYVRTKSHLFEKYGEGGYLKLWLETGVNKKNLDELRKNIKIESKIRDDFEKLYKICAK